MVICKVSCPCFNTCRDREPFQRCIYDLGMFNDEEDKNDIEELLERRTY